MRPGGIELNRKRTKVWWHTRVVPAPGTLRQEDCQLETVCAT